jgi:uncharacterized membrane protein (UPF0127 family)
MPVLTSTGVLAESGSQPRLPVVNLRLGTGHVSAEVASTPTQAATGLSFRTALPPDGAMLFTYSLPHRLVYHMKDTLIPLSIAYIDSLGIILEMYDPEPGSSTPVVSHSSAVRFVLEVNRGWFHRHGVTPGSRIYVEQ